VERLENDSRCVLSDEDGARPLAGREFSTGNRRQKIQLETCTQREKKSREKMSHEQRTPLEQNLLPMTCTDETQSKGKIDPNGKNITGTEKRAER
jgi:hypothetical protein